jgi:ATP phosphoribosyltransferase
MLRVAIPNKGILSDASVSILKEAGYTTRRDEAILHLVDEANDIEFFYLRPRDIATYVGEGSLYAGITGYDLLMDSTSRAEVVADLGFGGSNFRLAVDTASEVRSIADLAGSRIATAYQTLLSKHLEQVSIKASVVSLDGAVESAIKLGVADAIADVVSTGNTLRKANLRIVGPSILHSTARLIASPGKSDACSKLLRRIEGVIVARDYVLMDYDCPKDIISKAIKITPGIESPTISPLADEHWVAVRALVKVAEVNRVMDELSEVGAKAILVTSLHAARI